MLLSYTLDHCRKFNYDFVLAGKFVYCHYLEHVLFSSSVFILYYSYSLLPFSLTPLHFTLYLIFNSISIQSAIRPTDPFATEGKEKDEINKLMRDVLASDGLNVCKLQIAHNFHPYNL